jgi:hypothetical protein
MTLFREGENLPKLTEEGKIELENFVGIHQETI